MKTTKQTIEGFDKEFLKDMGDECEPVFIDPVGCVGPIRCFIAEALEYQQKEIEKAFKNKYKGAGDVFFPYESQGNCTEKEALDYIDEQWKDIINSLKRRE